MNARCGFLSALTPLQPRYAKKTADEDSLMAVILAQAMNHGMLGMAETSDISYDVLEETHQQHLRLATLREANDKISNFIAGLDIFPLYSFNTETLYGGVDGQKFESATPTIKARYSRKYFGRGKGVVAYTLLANHIPLETELIGANEHESHYVFDICYNNTSDIVPTTITGDMHIINKVNFAITHWFGLKLSPRFTNLQAQVQHLYCGTNPPAEKPYLLQPAGQIDRQAIVAGNADLDRIIATLGLKEASQNALVRKLCALSQHNPRRKAVFEFDKLVRSIYTLNYFRDAQLQRDVHRSQNRLEAYHQLRSAIAQVGGRKQLAGRTDLDMAISNQCARLIANVIMHVCSRNCWSATRPPATRERSSCCGKSPPWPGGTSTSSDAMCSGTAASRSTLMPCSRAYICKRGKNVGTQVPDTPNANDQIGERNGRMPVRRGGVAP